MCVCAVELRLIQPSTLNVSPTSSVLASGTRIVSLMPSMRTALFPPPARAPGTPRTGPLTYVPLLALPLESSAVRPEASPKRQ